MSQIWHLSDKCVLIHILSIFLIISLIEFLVLWHFPVIYLLLIYKSFSGNCQVGGSLHNVTYDIATGYWYWSCISHLLITHILSLNIVSSITCVYLKTSAKIMWFWWTVLCPLELLPWWPYESCWWVGLIVHKSMLPAVKSHHTVFQSHVFIFRTMMFRRTRSC